MSNYSVKTIARTAVPRSKRLREGAAPEGGTTGSWSLTGGHTHSNKDALDLFRYDPARNVIYVGDEDNPINLAAYGQVSGGGINGETPTLVTTTLGGLMNVTNESDNVQTVDKILVRRANASGNNSWTLANLSDISGTVVGIRMNGTVKSPGTDKIVDLGTIITSLAGYATETYVSNNFLASSLKGAANGLAELGSDGKVPSSQLPSYVDDVLEYSSTSAFPATGESGKIYVALDTNKTYRWGGSEYVEISASLALGETSSTAYRGDRGKIAYDHSQISGGSTVHHTHSNKAALDLLRYDAQKNLLYIGDENNRINFAAYGAVSAGGIGSGGGGGARCLYQLEDVPDYRTSYRGKYLRAKSDGTGTEWVDVTGGVSSVINLTGDISQAQLRTALGLGSLAYLNGLSASDVTTALGSTYVQNANYATNAGNADTVDSEHASAFAHIGAHNNLMASGNEFTFASSGFSGAIYLNYRTAGGINGNITDYYFANGKGGTLWALSTIASNASNGNTAYSWGNHASAGYATQTWVKGSIPALVTAGGRVYGSGDDEGIIISKAPNGYAGLTLGSSSGVRSVFYLASGNPFWRYNNGTTSYDISHPSKTGTIALTSDLSNYQPLATAINTSNIASQSVAYSNYSNGLYVADERSSYPATYTGTHRIHATFMRNSVLGISGYGDYSDVIIVRGYGDTSGGAENALIFNKNSNSLWRTQFSFGSTTSWGTPRLIYDSGNLTKATLGLGNVDNTADADKSVAYAWQAAMKNTNIPLSSINATASSAYVWNSRSNSWVFENNNNALAITVGGTQNDRNANIQVGHSAANYGQHTGNLYLNKLGGNVYIGNGNTVYHSGNCNNTSTSWACSNLTASGNIVGSGQVAAGSDIRWKENITPVRPNVIDCLNPVEWDWKEGHGNGHSAGLIAQQVARILPFAVMGNEADGYVLNYNVFHAYEISELQSLRRRVAELERKLNIFKH